MINGFEEWATPLSEWYGIEQLSGAVVAIEAADYLNSLIRNPNTIEALLPALGGLPFSLRGYVLKDVSILRSHGINPVFVFSGLDVGKDDNKRDAAFRASDEAARIHASAWLQYDQHKPEEAVKTFKESAVVKPEDLFRYLQKILREAGVPFKVAPYSALAQLAYLDKHAGKYVDAIAGSTELFLYDVDKVITDLGSRMGQIVALRKHSCITELGNIPSEVFVDACLLCGNALIPPIPQLGVNSRRNKPKIQAAVDLLMNTPGRDGNSVCSNYQDDPQFRAMQYQDKYRRTRLAIKHHVVLTAEGKAVPLDEQEAPRDVHELVGQQLPEEIYFYLSKGVIGPRVLNWRSSGEIIELAPLDGGDSPEYRKLVLDQLTPLRTSALSLLSYSLHRFYQHKDVTLYCWFDQGTSKVISMRDLTDPRPLVAKWNVNADLIQKHVLATQSLGLIGSTVCSLKNKEFASQTITTKDPHNLLATKNEIMCNAFWRFLQLREYTDTKHQLTPWGEVLEAAISALGGRSELDEAVFIAIELARLELLGAKDMFPQNAGASLHADKVDRRNTLIVSRIACLGKLSHAPIGYTGPLSRHLLAYHSMITAVRSSLRDLAEVSLVTMLLNGDAHRGELPHGRKDYTDLGLELPFLLDNDCGLGIAVQTYLDELQKYPDPTSAEARAASKGKAPKDYFPHAIDLSRDLDSAFLLWDAVYAGMKKAVEHKLVKEGSMWDDVNKWLANRR
ncbi:hypothetical protein W97_09278 [Coniosporium apollinis CBS 100218]|uniref:XPG N-terminal domain-containing protein n=1 Tax=Coniosporium apollinis (strain CBS 100218) TaxID=1168221 RepID=R7Z779_CONA1|nr:uncharacterized protein W97_09278 [Coniosporium apollinis CBS 100218]EON70012.1 hypothetical protein W97_09278 [Coniosporium apollinis CBS 100218]